MPFSFFKLKFVNNYAIFFILFLSGMNAEYEKKNYPGRNGKYSNRNYSMKIFISIEKSSSDNSFVNTVLFKSRERKESYKRTRKIIFNFINRTIF